MTDEQFDKLAEPFMGKNENGVPYFRGYYEHLRQYARTIERAVLAEQAEPVACPICRGTGREGIPGAHCTFCDGTGKFMRGKLPAGTVRVPVEFLSEFVNVCEVCDINDDMDPDGYGWKDLYQRAKAMIVAAPK